jgi:hypothetical protein
MVRKNRRDERGAVLFVAVMAISLVMGLGVWSMYSASLLDRASGFGRQSAQAQYLSEFGILTVTALLSVPGQAKSNHDVASSSTAVGADTCTSLAAGDYCRAFLDTALNDLTSNAIPTAQPIGTGANLVDDTAGGSFGPVQDPLTNLSVEEGNFRVEMTDAEKVNIAGSAVGESGYRRVTLTSYARIRPRANGAAVCSAPENSVAVETVFRTHSVIGPLY